MHCPHPLQANQIQGSDFAAMYPVIQWLVKKVGTVRVYWGPVSLGRVSVGVFGMDSGVDGGDGGSGGGGGGGSM